jgi:hypothetical protein
MGISTLSAMKVAQTAGEKGRGRVKVRLKLAQTEAKAQQTICTECGKKRERG